MARAITDEKRADILFSAMGAALDAVTSLDILGWVRHCGYRLY